MMYSLNEIGIIPTALSNIEHRGDVNPFYEDKNLPIFVSPMSCILDEKNIQTFQDSRAIPIMPRSVSLTERSIWCSEGGHWSAFSLQEFESNFVETGTTDKSMSYNVLIDIANGHMKRIYDDVRKAKDHWGNRLTVMVGNIANPNTYLECCKAGVDYVRVGIGGGSACHKDGTMITMADGTKKAIEEINIGDFVKTLNGTGAVTATTRYKTNECLQINNSIISTPNHKFLVIKKSDKDFVTEENLNKYAFYLEAEKLTNDYLLVQSV